MTLKIVTGCLVMVLVGFAVFTLRDARDGWKVMKGKVRAFKKKMAEHNKFVPNNRPEIRLKWGSGKKAEPVELNKKFSPREIIHYTIGNPEGKADIAISYPGLMPKHAVIELVETDDNVYYVFRNCGGRGNSFMHLKNGVLAPMRKGEEVMLRPEVEGDVFYFGSNKKNALRIIISVPEITWDPTMTARKLNKEKEKAAEDVMEEDVDSEEEYDDMDEFDDEDYDEEDYDDMDDFDDDFDDMDEFDDIDEDDIGSKRKYEYDYIDL